jgi:MoaA/NifB/PqqE/SkfB family radical SAM enzyme
MNTKIDCDHCGMQYYRRNIAPTCPNCNVAPTLDEAKKKKKPRRVLKPGEPGSFFIPQISPTTGFDYSTQVVGAGSPSTP